MPGELLYFNGVNGATGEYLLAPQTPNVISKIAQDETLDQAQVKELKFWYQRVTQQHLGPKEGVDPKDLGQAGWGVIFAFQDQDRIPAVKEALGELLRLRETQAKKVDGATTRNTPAPTPTARASPRSISWRASGWAPVPPTRPGCRTTC